MSDDDYWSQSSASQLKGVDLFGDVVTVTQIKDELLNRSKQMAIEDDDDDEWINFDGTPARTNKAVSVVQKDSGGKMSGSARYKPPTGLNLANTTAPDMLGGRGTVLSGRTYSAPKPSQKAADSDLLTDDGISLKVESVSSHYKQPTLTEVSKMESTINRLKRELYAVRKDRFTKIPPRETVRRIVFGQPYSLEPYKGKEEKLVLLDEAIRCHDGNAIIAVVLFFRDTIKTSIFNQEICRRPVAVHHYLYYLKLHHDTQELLDFLGMLHQRVEAAILCYKQACRTSHTPTKIKSLQTCYRTHMQSEPYLQHEAAMVNEHVALLERQLPIEEADSKCERDGDLRFKQNPRVSSLVNQPVMTTLYYFCLYHYNLQDNNLASPMALKKTHSMTDKQYEWMAMIARARLKQWPDLDNLFEAKGWFGSKKQKSVIGFDRIIPALHKQGAPKVVLNKFCALIDDSAIRLQVAIKHDCHEVAIDTLKQQRDREQLVAYKGRLTANSQEWFYAQDVLKSSTIKWKN